MADKICLGFKVHQPVRIKPYRFFDVGNHSNYFDDDKNKEMLQSVAKSSYYPTNNLILDLIDETDGDFKVSYVLSGPFLKNALKHEPKLIESFNELVKSGAVELMGTTSNRCACSVRSREEFKNQVKQHREELKKQFGVEPKVFSNTHFMINNEITHDVNELGYEGALCDGLDQNKSPNYLFSLPNGVKVLARNKSLSDDLEKNFSNKTWSENPLSAEKFVDWVKKSDGDVVNLFMDYEAFGEKHHKDTGIFEFLENLPQIAKKEGINFVTPSDMLEKETPKDLELKSLESIETKIDKIVNTELSSKLFDQLYSIEEDIRNCGDAQLLADWQKLISFDHLIFMNRLNQDIHKNHAPYESEYDIYMAMRNIIKDVFRRLEEKKQEVLEKPIAN